MSIVQYGSHPRQVYLHYERKAKPSIVFIHGGAWRDPNNTCYDFKKWAEYLGDFNVFSIDYRLAPEYQHPSQLNDVRTALERILETIDQPITLCGHSVGATLICQVIESNGFNSQIKELILMDGIYSINDLIRRYPDYEGFVLEEYGDVEATKKSTFIDLGFKSDIYKSFKIKIVYSEGDELLDWQCSELFINWLDERKVGFETIRGQFGKHNDVYESLEVVKKIIS